jgi:hypothetical protein
MIISNHNLCNNIHNRILIIEINNQTWIVTVTVIILIIIVNILIIVNIVYNHILYNNRVRR